jgi:hypothetical protein
VPELLKIIFRQMPDSFATVIPRCIPARRLHLWYLLSENLNRDRCWRRR